MLLSAIPAKFDVPFANAAAGPEITYPVPATTATPGRAALDTGFPPLNFLARGAGGIPPFGQDFNGVLKQVSGWSRWQAAGAVTPYDGTFQTAIGGYPKGAIVMSATALNQPLMYQSLVDDNLTDPDAGGAGWVTLRQRLSAATNFYVRTDGSDTNTGLANNAAGAFLTGAGALAALQKLWDTNGFQVTLNFGTGTFAAFSVLGLVGQRGDTPLIINGNGSANTTFTTISGGQGAVFRIQNAVITSTSYCLSLTNACQCYIGVDIKFVMTGGAGIAHLYATFGAFVQIEQNTSFQGNSQYSVLSRYGAVITSDGRTFTYVGGPTFSISFAASAGSMVITSTTFSGAVTGSRYSVDLNGVLYTNGAGATYLPGSTAGSTTTGGQYA